MKDIDRWVCRVAPAQGADPGHDGMASEIPNADPELVHPCDALHSANGAEKRAASKQNGGRLRVGKVVGEDGVDDVAEAPGPGCGRQLFVRTMDDQLGSNPHRLGLWIRAAILSWSIRTRRRIRFGCRSAQPDGDGRVLLMDPT